MGGLNKGRPWLLVLVFLTAQSMVYRQIYFSKQRFFQMVIPTMNSATSRQIIVAGMRHDGIAKNKTNQIKIGSKGPKTS